MIRTYQSLLIVEAFETAIALSTRSAVPTVVYVGSPLAPEAIEDLAAVDGQTRARPKSTLDVERNPTLCPVAGDGWSGRPGLELRAIGPTGTYRLSPRLGPAEIEIGPGEAEGEERARMRCVDPAGTVELVIEFVSRSTTIGLRLELVNTGADPIEVDHLAPAVVLPDFVEQLVTLNGWWSHEFGPVRHELRAGTFVWTNRKGRTSHDRVPAVWAGEAGFGDRTGRVLGATLAWSGNASLQVDRLGNGARVLQGAELYEPGGVRLEPAGSYTTPWLELAYSDSGTNPTSAAFHGRVREIGPAKHRLPVYLNTWEAVYFDHDLDRLTQLAERAARIGIERFVLDDGWFHRRRHDRAGLGDWWVDETVWPDGLGPLIDRVLELGMEFGIWVEPEMVNPESDLFEAHPEWVFGSPGPQGSPVLGRNQLALDMGRADVRAYLLDKLDSLLANHPISYLKWDMNRDVVLGSDPAADSRAWTLGLYELVDELARRHPTVDIESCSSGGARADLGILERTMRIWTSDSNDALERQRIQSGFSMLFPPEVMGAHVGPPRSHTSGRSHDLTFRLATAFTGSMGVEWNLLAAHDRDLDRLTAAIAEYKRCRHILIGGRVERLETGDPSTVSHMVVAPDRSQALWSFACLDLGLVPVPGRLRLSGLDPAARYRVNLIDLGETPGPVDDQVGWFDKGNAELSGAYLTQVGIEPPALNPQSAFVAHIESR